MEILTSRRDARRSRRAATWAAMLLAAAPLPGAREVSLREFAAQIGSTSPLRLTPEGIGVDVDGRVGIFLPLTGAEALQIDYRSAGFVMLTWNSGSGNVAPVVYSPPWHRQILPPGPGRVTLELRTTPLWSVDRVPFLFLQGTGTVIVTGLRVRAVAQDLATRTDAFDETLRWAPIRVGHTTINFIDVPFWSASRNVLLQDVLGIAFAVLAVAGALGWWVTRRRWRPGPAIALAAIAAATAGNVVFAVRAAPALSLAPSLDPDARLRNWTAFDPELGPLAALARGAIGPKERVGVFAKRSDWFGWETLCFHLAPRPCVQVVTGSPEYSGLHGVDRLRLDQIDALIFFHAEAPLPPGFAPSVVLDKNAFVARRR
jgi:hypothetical protein